MGNSSPTAASTHDRADAPIDPTETVGTPDHGSDSMTLDEDDKAGLGGGTDTQEASAPESIRAGQDANQDTNQGAGDSRPPLPPRPSLLRPANRPGSSYASKPTTGFSPIDIQTLSFPDGSRGTFQTPTSRSVSVSESISGASGGHSTPSRKIGLAGSEFDDSASLRSYAPTMRANGDLASLLDEGLSSKSAAWKLLSTQTESVNAFEQTDYEDSSLVNFEQEFDEVEAVENTGANGGI